MERRWLYLFGGLLLATVAALFIQLKLFTSEARLALTEPQRLQFEPQPFHHPTAGCLPGEGSFPRVLVGLEEGRKLSAGKTVTLPHEDGAFDCLKGADYAEVISQTREDLLFREIGLVRVQSQGKFILHNEHEILGTYDARVFAPYFPGVQILSRDEMKALGGKILDVRSQGAWNGFHIPGSISLPYVVSEHPWNIGLPLHKASTSDRFDTQGLNPEEALVVVAQNPRDGRAVRALFVLGRRGFQKLYWYWGGVNDYRGEAFVTPHHPTDLRVVSAKEAAKMLAQGALPIDGRNIGLFRFGHVQGAQQINSPEEWIMKSQAEVLTEIASSDFGDKRKIFPAHLLESEKIWVVYGEDATDWNAYFAALVAHGVRGSGRVMWMRGGFAEWRSLWRQEPKRFKIVGEIASGSGGSR